MRSNRPLYSKYSCDDKLGIYSNPKISKKNYQYKKAISGVRSKYMQDYNESKRIYKKLWLYYVKETNKFY